MSGTQSVPLSFGVQSRKGRFGPDGTNQLINAYVEDAGEEAKTPAPIYCVDGLKPLVTISSASTRQVYGYRGDVYAVIGPVVHRVSGSSSVTLGGVAPNGFAFFARNRREVDPQIVLTTGLKAYTIINNMLAEVTDPDLLPVNCVEFMDGYFIFGIEDSSAGKYQLSAIEDGTSISALDVGAAESDPDKIVRAIRRKSELWLMGEETIEVHANTGNAAFPFERLQGAAVDRGCISAGSVQKIEESIYWVADDFTVRRAAGYTAEKISTHSVDRSISAESDKSAITSLSYAKDGHTYYEISGAGFTWRYDLSTGKWIELASYGKPRWRASCATKTGNDIVVGDYYAGKLYTVDSEWHKDGNDPLVWKIRSPIFHNFPNATQWKELAFDILPGVGLTSTSEHDAEPYAMLRWSDDGGKTWSNELRGYVGKRGEYGTQVVFHDLGQCGGSGRVWELSMSAAVSKCLMGVKAQIRRTSR